MRRADLERVARRVAGILGEKDCVLVGGLAVGAHGYVRATRGVDFVARVPLREARDRLKKHGIDASLSHGDVLGGDFPCLHGTIGGVRFDVMPPLVPLEWDRVIELPLGKRATLRVVDLDGLIRLKLRAGGPKDLVDVAVLVLKHPEHRGRAREIAAAYRLADELDVWLADPRLRKELAEATTGKGRRR